MEFPRMFEVRQRFEGRRVRDVAGAIRGALAQSGVLSGARRGGRVAITAGSRGIAQGPTVLRAVAAALRDSGLEPFVIPAMGSHGGGTAQGQREVLGRNGITEQTVGAPVCASMEVVCLGEAPEGFPVYLDRYASEADYIAVVNRVKPHTEFLGGVQSGLLKMMAMGLGKAQGAATYHQAAVREGAIDRIAGAVTRMTTEAHAVLFGLGIVENARCQIAHVEAAGPEGMAALDARLLALATRWMPWLPFDEMDLLVVDEMGKNISGTGMDSNVIGRKSWAFGRDPDERPRIRRILVRDLTEESQGNACGLGLADFALRRVVDKMDVGVSYLNAITCTRPRGVMIPMTFGTDREAIQAAMSTLGVSGAGEARVARIKNTLELERLEVSEALLPQLAGRSGVTVSARAWPMAFDRDGYLETRWRSGGGGLRGPAEARGVPLSGG